MKGKIMEGKDAVYVTLWVVALVCTMMAWMYWGVIPASLYSFVVSLLLFEMSNIFYCGSAPKGDKGE